VSLLLLCWNVAGRVARLPEQVELVGGQGADVVCLQEVTARTAPVWRRELADQGYRGIEQAPLAGGRSLAVLTAAREEPVAVVAVDDLPLPERVLAVRLADGLEVVNVHSPISTRGALVKVRTHEAVHRHLAGPADHPRLVCGDLNTPRREHADGRIWTFARDQYGRLRPDRGERWDEAELALIRGLEAHGFRDGFRALHGWDRRDLSWEWPRHGGGYRLDHLVVSDRLEVLGCEYEHGWRRDGLSDHSPLLARLRVTDSLGSSML
jgi:exonuclease III